MIVRTFAEVLAAQPWRPIAGCPGRYVLGPPTPTTAEEVLGGGARPTEHRIATAPDVVVVARVEGGGLISYRRGDGIFVRTLGNEDGFTRKLAQLGIERPA